MGNFLLFPQDGKVRVTSPFGWRGPAMHRGVDLASDNLGADYNLAAADAFVTRVAYEASGAGYWLEAKVDFPVDGKVAYIRYYHNKESVRFYDRPFRPPIKLGSRIVQGERIGIEGNTGSSAGSHLHFELRLGGNLPEHAVNPVPYLWIPKSLPIDSGVLTQAQFKSVKYVEDFRGESEEMKYGDKGEHVKALQNLLINFKHSVGPEGADGMFFGGTKGGIESFQRQQGLPVNGLVDEMTLATLFNAAINNMDKAKALGKQLVDL